MSAFSSRNPNLQLAWDSTSLQSIQFCPRSYQYGHLEGWTGSTVDLEFGGFAASAWERFQKARIEGLSKLDACKVALAYAMEASDGWGGVYETQWRCTGVEKYKNSKGNAAKCPYSHKGAFFFGDRPSQCGECGSPTEEVRNYIPATTAKNRHTLIRMIVWYCLDQPDDLDDGLRPYVFPDGTPAVELSFNVPIPLFAKESYSTEYGVDLFNGLPISRQKLVPGEQYSLAGYLDYIGVFGEELFVVDNKTTTKTLDTKFFSSYSPSFQFDTYDLIGTMLFPTLPIKGVLLDGAQTTAKEARFGRHPYYKTEAMREEHYRDIKFWIKLAERFAEEGYWPMNKRNCWLCPFKEICSMDPGVREQYLKANFHKRDRWDPTIPR